MLETAAYSKLVSLRASEDQSHDITETPFVGNPYARSGGAPEGRTATIFGRREAPDCGGSGSLYPAWTDRGAPAARRHLFVASFQVALATQAGPTAGPQPHQRGPKAAHTPEQDEIARLKRENARLQAKLEQAEAIIDIQKKVSALLGLPPTEQ